MGNGSEADERHEESGGLKVMIAVDDSPESKAALCWAVDNLVAKEDWFLIYHIVKPIPNTRGRVSHTPASPGSQSNHNRATHVDATRFLIGMEAYCHERKIFPRMQVGGCVRRQTGIVDKVRAEGITHLVMGTKKGKMFALKSWGFRRSLTTRVCQEVECHMTLVDKEMRPTFYRATATADLRTRSVSLSAEAMETVERNQLHEALSGIADKQRASKADNEKRNRRGRNQGPPKGSRRHSMSSMTRGPASPMSAGRLKSARDFYAPSVARAASVLFLDEDEDDVELEQEEVFADKFMQKKEPQNIQVIQKKEPQTIEFIQKKEPQNTEFIQKKEPQNIEFIQKKEPQNVELQSPIKAPEPQAYTPSSPAREVKSIGSPLRSFSSSPSRWFGKKGKAPTNAELETDLQETDSKTVENVAKTLRKAQEADRKAQESIVLSTYEEDVRISQEAVITQLWEQVEKLKKINVLRDHEIEKVAWRAQLAEKEAQERERALAKQSRELAELRAEKLAQELAALKESPDAEDLHEYQDWCSFAGGALWTISEEH